MDLDQSPIPLGDALAHSIPGIFVFRRVRLFHAAPLDPVLQLNPKRRMSQLFTTCVSNM
jgi:hypothetical protein